MESVYRRHRRSMKEAKEFEHLQETGSKKNKPYINAKETQKKRKIPFTLHCQSNTIDNTLMEVGNAGNATSWIEG